MADLNKEFQYYLDHQDELVKKYNGKFLVIKNEEVQGAYKTSLEALIEAKKKFEAGSFLIQECGEGKKNHTATLHSRVIFS